MGDITMVQHPLPHTPSFGPEISGKVVLVSWQSYTGLYLGLIRPDA